MTSFFACLILGMILSFPCGPMGMLGATRASNGDVKSARALAIGVSCADGVLALLASMSMTLPFSPRTLILVSIVLTLWLAFQLVRPTKVRVRRFSGAASFGFGASATLLHPGNMITFGLAFGWLHSMGLTPTTPSGYIAVVLGVSAGTMFVWWQWLRLAVTQRSTRLLRRWQPYLKYGMAVTCLVGVVTMLPKLMLV